MNGVVWRSSFSKLRLPTVCQASLKEQCLCGERCSAAATQRELAARVILGF